MINGSWWDSRVYFCDKSWKCDIQKFREISLLSSCCRLMSSKCFSKRKKKQKEKIDFLSLFCRCFFFLKQFLFLKFFSCRRATNIKGSLNKWSSKKGTQENLQRIKKNCRMKCTQLRKQPMLRVGGEVNTFFIYSFFLFNIGTFTFIFDRAFSWFWTRGSKKGWLVYVLSK